MAKNFIIEGYSIDAIKYYLDILRNRKKVERNLSPQVVRDACIRLLKITTTRSNVDVSNSKDNDLFVLENAVESLLNSLGKE